jgi:major membrane immunogen (membrane-anchored lipoprotein)
MTGKNSCNMKEEKMSKKIVLISVLVAGLLLSACASSTAATPTETALAAEPILTLSGAAAASWNEADLKAMTMLDADYTNKDGETTTYTGVAINDLLAAAGVSDYAAISLIASDGYSADVTSEELAACSTCIVAFDDDGTLRSVFPDFSSKQQVKDLVEISVQ